MGTIAPQYDEARKLYFIEYQAQDDDGNPVGRPQKFEDATLEGLVSKTSAAHQNVMKAYSNERKARKLGDLMDVDPAQPLQTFEGRVLSADELTKLAKEISSPAGLTSAFRAIIEAEFGAPLSVIRRKLQYAEVRERVDVAEQETNEFLSEHPDYYPDPRNHNKSLMLKWLDKHGLSITKKNLERAFEDLREDLVQAPLPATVSSTATPVAAGAVIPAPAAVVSAPPSGTGDSGIPTTATLGDSGELAEGRRTPSTSSSGLSRAQAAPLPANAAKAPTEAPEITLAELNRLSAAEYAQWLSDPRSRAAIAKLDASGRR